MKYLFGLLLLLVIFPVSGQENMIARLPQPSSPFPQWAYWNPTHDTILVSNGKTMQLYTSDFYLLRDIRLVPEDIDANPEKGVDVLFGAVWHPTGQWIMIDHYLSMEIWNADLTTKLYTSPPQGSMDQGITWHSQKPWLAFTSYRAPIRIFDFMTQKDIATHKGWVVSGLAWWPGTDKLAFIDTDGFTVWDVTQNTFIHPPITTNESFLFNRSGSLLADTHQGKPAAFCTDTWEQVFYLELENYFNHLDWIDDHRIGVLDNTEQLSISDINTGQTIFLDTLPKGNFGMSWNASGSRFLVIAPGDITIRDTNTGEVLASLKAVLDGTVIPPMPIATP